MQLINPPILFFVFIIFQFALENEEVTGQKVSNRRPGQTFRFPQFQKQKRRKAESKRNQFFGNHRARAVEHAIINGQYMETNRILIQRKNMLGLGYFPYGVTKLPLFIRQQPGEMNKKYIVFPDPYLPPGEGYLVVLKRVPLNIADNPMLRLLSQGSRMPIPDEIPYEAFHLVLGNNIHGSFNRVNVRRFAYGIRTKFYERGKAKAMMALRRKKMSRFRRRFGISRWRGKRDIHNSSANLHFNVSLESYAKIFNDDARVLVNPCQLQPLNITALRLRLKKLELMRFVNQSLVYTEDYDFNADEDLQHINM